MPARADRLLDLARPARLRRQAEFLELHAAACPMPEDALELARKMRVRAAELEVGVEPATVFEKAFALAEDYWSALSDEDRAMLERAAGER